MRGIIYKVENISNRKVYIGSSMQGKTRLLQHKNRLLNNNHSNNSLQKAWNDYGRDKFKFEILIKVQPSYLEKAEQYWIDKFKAYKEENGYNENRYVVNLVGERNPNWSGRIDKNCDHCGDSFSVKPSLDRVNYCSTSCATKDRLRNSEYHHAWKGGKVTLTCKYCDGSFEVYPFRANKAKYCGESCRSSDLSNGEDNSRAKLSKEEAISIKFLAQNTNISQYDLADEYDISQSLVTSIKSGRNWSELPDLKL